MVPTFLIQTQAPSNPILGFLPILLIFAIFYFLLFMPMQRQKKQQQKMLKELQTGSVVVTSGGIVGTIVAIDEDTLGAPGQARQHQDPDGAQRRGGAGAREEGLTDGHE